MNYKEYTRKSREVIALSVRACLEEQGLKHVHVWQCQNHIYADIVSIAYYVEYDNPIFDLVDDNKIIRKVSHSLGVSIYNQKIDDLHNFKQWA